MSWLNPDKFYCDNCKLVLEPDDLEEVEDPRPGAYGQPCCETFYVCPECGDIPSVYDYQDKTCKDCELCGTEECPYGEERKDGKVCGDFVEEE